MREFESKAIFVWMLIYLSAIRFKGEVSISNFRERLISFHMSILEFKKNLFLYKRVPDVNLAFLIKLGRISTCIKIIWRVEEPLDKNC